MSAVRAARAGTHVPWAPSCGAPSARRPWRHVAPADGSDNRAEHLRRPCIHTKPPLSASEGKRATAR